MVLKGIEQTARGLGFSVLIGAIGAATKPLERYFADIRAGRADGIILLAGHTVELAGFGRKIADTPLAVIGAIDPKHQVTCLSVDNFSAAYKATRYLLNLGHKRIGHIAGPLSSFEMKARHDGFLSAMTDAGLQVPGEFIRAGNLQAHSGVRIGEDLALMKDRPTAIFCANDQMAIGTMAGLRKGGLTVPKDMSIVGFDDSELVVLLNPPLTTIRQPSFEFGRQAMLDLHSLITGESDHPPTRIFESELVIRESCAACPD
jgi:LacI family repressor for deo operon, udp, cdd, tsx, nupC, and nupG